MSETAIGYRPFNPTRMHEKHFGKLKDPNAIPYLEKAMLRSTGQEQRDIERQLL